MSLPELNNVSTSHAATMCQEQQYQWRFHEPHKIFALSWDSLPAASFAFAMGRLSSDLITACLSYSYKQMMAEKLCLASSTPRLYPWLLVLPRSCSDTVTVTVLPVNSLDAAQLSLVDIALV